MSKKVEVPEFESFLKSISKGLPNCKRCGSNCLTPTKDGDYRCNYCGKSDSPK